MSFTPLYFDFLFLLELMFVQDYSPKRFFR